MKKFIVFIAAFVFFSGCIRVYKVSKVRKHFNKAVNSTNQVKSRANGDYSKNKKIYDSIIAHIDQKDMQPYPLLRSHLERMKGVIDKLTKTGNAVAGNRARFNSVVGGNSKIKSNRPIWKKFQKVKDEFEDNISTLRKDVKAYENASRAFISTLNQHKISKVDAVNIKNKVSRFINRVVSVLKGAKTRIGNAGGKLKKLESQGYDKKVVQEKRSILTEMEKILDKINVENREITKLNTEFEKEAGNRKSFWAGPGMITHSILMNIKEKGNRVSALGNEFSALGNKFNKKSKKK